MGVLHEVAGATTGGLLADDLPVTERLDLRTNVADGGSEVTNAKSALGLVAGESLAAGEVVDDTTLLGESVVHKNDLQCGCYLKKVRVLKPHPMFLNSTVTIIVSSCGLSTLLGDNFEEKLRHSFEPVVQPSCCSRPPYQ